ncbi:unnamed protein product [Arabidopsis thaliana]|uniref:H15 domain-containing protein n=4 Tax=Arabidopsis TaxID=3701 RepID=A0A654EK21_ARATH|nr:Winged helix-turn-helix transcription repressor DNA-binding protein [Arabidopsis thaliana]AEE33069.1 Winged helix-turn-helix transcription repressor DNA-binding protein [Arabidopsis thaliana]KAG7649587.1 Linker histone H1/H5 domain H15 [Arabidopsis thaliana x Arabidopsis arenosa]KAG7657456.1 Linker histone H1/H5 domain H15 [Arabidopsis suecica]VYS49070.1 unnamed protein product [Arabidopsis thaliana]|eukprot:NP_175825.2 Winged helix-turn-helix transcription repressor DNA-binding protein [Arabidopsis thaliana]
MDSADANVTFEYTLSLDDMVFEALSTIDDEHDGTGRDVDGIFKFNNDRYVIPDNSRERLRGEVEKLVAERKIEKVGNRYMMMMPQRVPATREDSTTPQRDPQAEAVAKLVAETEHLEFQAKEAQELADRYSLMLNSECIILELAVEILNRCANGQMIFLCTSLVPRAPEENPQMDAVAKLIAEAEHLEFQAKEAQELADKHAQLLELESEIILQLAVEIFNRCANGQKIFLR